MPSLFAAAPALVPCPSASALAHRLHRHCRHRRRRMRLADCRRPLPPSLSHHSPHHPINLRHRRPAPPQSLSPPSRLCRHHRRHQSRAFWVIYLSTYRGIRINLRHRRPAPPQSLSPPSRLCRHHRRHQSRAFWVIYLSTYRRIRSPVSEKQKSVV